MVALAIIRNDLKLFFRGMRTGRRAWRSTTVMGVLLLLLHGPALLIAFAIRRHNHADLEAMGWSLAGFMMLTSAIVSMIGVLFERSDFDFLLSSPAPPQQILIARMASVATATFLTGALLLMPGIDAAMILFSPRYAAGFLAWMLEAVIVSAVAAGIALGTVRVLGTRRARVGTQMFATLVGVTWYVAFQTWNLSRRSPHPPAVFGWLRSVRRLIGVDELAAAGRGEPRALAEVALAAVAGMILMAVLFRRVFVKGIQDAETRRSRRAGRAKDRTWNEGLTRAATLKDLRLIARDPVLLARMLPELMGLLPLIFVFWRMTGVAMLGVLAFGVAVLGARLLTEICADGEEAWDLIRLSPTAEVSLRWAKVWAGVTVPLGIATVLCFALACLGRPWIAACDLGVCGVCAVAAARVQSSYVRPTPRKDLLARGRRAGFKMATLSTVLGVFVGAGALGALAARPMGARLVGAGVVFFMVVGAAIALALVSAKPVWFSEAE